MNNTRPIFFADENRRQTVRNVLAKVSGGLDAIKDSQDEKHKFLLESIVVTLHRIQSAPESFDERCIMNISVLGKELMDELADFSLSKEDAEHLFAMCYRFVVEYQLSSPARLSSDFVEMLTRVSDFEFEGTVALQIKYAGHQMLVNIVQHYLYHPSLVDLKELPKVIERSEEERKNSEELIEKRQARIDALQEKLEKYETAFNFVGLYAGFKSMRSVKISEKRWNFFYLIILGGLLLLPFIIKLNQSYSGEVELKADLIALATFTGLEILLLYFFRVALHNFRSIKTQLLQIDLRMTLCQFVQSYAEYAREARQGSPESLDRFEQVVFSGIVNDEGSIPSTFDGLDKLAELVAKVRKG